MEPDRVGSHTGAGVSGHGGPPEPKAKSKQSRVNKGQRIIFCYCDVIEAMVVNDCPGSGYECISPLPLFWDETD